MYGMGREHQRWVGGCGVTREHAGARPVRGDGRVYRIASDTRRRELLRNRDRPLFRTTEEARLAVDSGGA
jgi:hypothetical protein